MISRDTIAGLYDLYSEELFRYVRRFADSHEAAEDLLHDLFIKFIRYVEKKPVTDTNTRALLYSIGRSVCLDAVKKNKLSRRDIQDPERISLIPDPHTSGEERDPLLEFFNSIIDTLPEPEQSIMLMRKNGLTFDEISAALNISVRTAKRKAGKALEIIREKYRSSSFYSGNDMKSGDKSLY